jgi:hypothetical protein
MKKKKRNDEPKSNKNEQNRTKTSEEYYRLRGGGKRSKKLRMRWENEQGKWEKRRSKKAPRMDRGASWRASTISRYDRPKNSRVREVGAGGVVVRRPDAIFLDIGRIDSIDFSLFGKLFHCAACGVPVA